MDKDLLQVVQQLIREVLFVPARVPEMLGHSLFKLLEKLPQQLKLLFSGPLIAMSVQVLLDVGYQVVDITLHGLMGSSRQSMPHRKAEGKHRERTTHQVNVQDSQDKVGIESLLRT